MKKEMKRLGKQWVAACLAALMVLGVIPVGQPTAAQAASWMDPYLQKLVSWGVMRGDQAGNLAGDRSITRAEFVSMINRAFGYKRVGGKVGFSDVADTAWYYDDIGIAKTAGYFQGKGSNRAEPGSPLTREEAVTLLGRNLMLEPGVGEINNFSDGRKISNWSGGIIKTAVQDGFISGYPDGTFRPQNNISRGEVAKLLVAAIGTPISQPGEQSLGGVYGNVMISTSGVTLKNTTISGDLYITAGVGLGNVTLDGVSVMGKIVVSGTGEGDKGKQSVILKNCKADKMVIDSPSNQTISVLARGNTSVEKTYVRTPTYLEDTSYGGNGLRYIELNGEEGTSLTLAGNVREVVNMNPKSSVIVGSGTVEKMTIDEQAVDSTLAIDRGAVVESLNLDVKTKVTGKGDIESLKVNAGGCTVEMLPDQIEIRPGLTATINGIVMDSVAAAQSSEDPRILSGYPKAMDIGPNSANSLFKTNKSGTLYWALTYATDGTVSADNLIRKPTYGANILKNADVKVKDADVSKELEAKISGLKPDTSFIVSAVLVDGRGKRSPVKSVWFTTPDNSVPNFSSGYPLVAELPTNKTQAAVSTTKTCKVYWAVYKTGRAAPSVEDFKADRLTGSLENGTFSATRSEEYYVELAKQLDELSQYDMYFWLTDGVNSSAVKKVSFKTADRTPPQFNTNYPRIDKVQEKALAVKVNVNEDCDVYWAAVKRGTIYPVGKDAGSLPLDSEEAKLLLVSGINALKSGKITAKKNADAIMTISGLEVQTGYDIYILPQDKAGLYAQKIVKIEGKTLDTVPPTAKQVFSIPSSVDNSPMPETDIDIVFSEEVLDGRYNKTLVELYQLYKEDNAEHKDKWPKVVSESLVLYDMSLTLPAPKAVDPKFVTAKLNDDGATVVTFANAGLGLLSGNKYEFRLSNIRDEATNRMPAATKLPQFTTVFAQVQLIDTGLTDDGNTTNPTEFNFTFKGVPLTTQKVSEGIKYDVILWADTPISFDLYRRYPKSSDAGLNQWKKVNTAEADITLSSSTPKGGFVGIGVEHQILGTAATAYPALKAFEEVEYAVALKSISGVKDKTVWDATVNMRITLAAGTANNLRNVTATGVTEAIWKDIAKRNVTSIGDPNPLQIERVISNNAAPKFINEYPRFEAGESAVNMSIQLDRPATLYYVIAPTDVLYPMSGSSKLPDAAIPPDGSGSQPAFDQPTVGNIMGQAYGTNPLVKQGIYDYKTTAVDIIKVEDLVPNKKYYAYFVAQSTPINTSTVHVFQFTMSSVTRPKLVLTDESPSVGFATIDPGSSALNPTYIKSDVDYVVFPFQTNGYPAIFNKVPVERGDTVWKMMVDGTFDALTGHDDLKAQVANEIRRQTGVGSGTSVSQGSLTGITKPTSVNFEPKLEMGTRYVVFAVAKNTLGSQDSFRAMTGLIKPDREAPYLVSVSTALLNSHESSFPTDKPNPNFNYDCSVTLTFSKDIYTLKDNATSPDDTTAVTPGNISGLVSYGAMSGYLESPTTATSMRTMTFRVKRATNGAQIIFNKDLCDINGISRSADAFTLTFDSFNMENGVLSPKFKFEKVK